MLRAALALSLLAAGADASVTLPVPPSEAVMPVPPPEPPPDPNPWRWDAARGIWWRPVQAPVTPGTAPARPAAGGGGGTTRPAVFYPALPRAAPAGC